VQPTRVGGDLRDGFGTVLLAEDAEEYELEILGPDDDVRRTVTGLTSATLTYTAAMQAENFPEGYPASAFVVYQISAQVGRLCWLARLPGRAAGRDTWRDHHRGPGRRFLQRLRGQRREQRAHRRRRRSPARDPIGGALLLPRRHCYRECLVGGPQPPLRT
jgi:hypothetical protein